MAKTLNNLTTGSITDLYDLIPIYDVSEAALVKTKKATQFDLLSFKNGVGKGFTFTIRNGMTLPLIDSINTRISVLDFIVFIDYSNLEGITFGIKNTFGSTWVDNTDPRLSYLTVGCGELGTNFVDIRMNNGSETIISKQTYFILQDNLGLCT